MVTEDAGGLGIRLGSALRELCDLSQTSSREDGGGVAGMAPPPSKDVGRVQWGLLPGSQLPR